ncbi:DUF397 domain-containing protein [Streptomyces sp. NPDC004542]|uniref:DUF397 domain-containing protein n=1 Tax=Streptomyces sp. NPDC004542 TaxID=3154281 RepID=UPI0033A87E23
MNTEHLTWVKSSYSGDAGGQCLEVALECHASGVHVRDSKAKSRPTLAFSADEWAAFVNFATRTAVG